MAWLGVAAALFAAGRSVRRAWRERRLVARWQLMLPGLGFFYGGLVQRKNVLSTIMHSFFILALISVQWVLWGFSLAFAPGGPFDAEAFRQFLRDAGLQQRINERLATLDVDDVRALTAWALLGNYDWCSLLTVEANHYEGGAFDLRSVDYLLKPVEPTKLARARRGQAGRCLAHRQVSTTSSDRDPHTARRPGRHNR